MAPEEVVVGQEPVISPPAEVVSVVEAVETEVPATSEEDQEIADLQAAIDAAETPEDKAPHKAKLNSAFAKMRREKQEAKRAELEAREDAAYQRGRAEASKRETPAAEAKPEPPAYVMPDFLKPAPRKEEFDYDEGKYAEAREEWLIEKAEHRAYHKAKSEIEADRQRRDSETFQQANVRWAQEGMKKFPDFVEVVSPSAQNIPKVMAEAVKKVKNSHEVAYHLGKNLTEFNRIAGLDNLEQAMEIAILSKTLSVKPAPAKTITNAPPPIKEVSPGVTSDLDPTKMSMEEYDKWRAEQSW